MSRHRLTWLRGDDEHEVTFEYRAGRPAVMHLRNGDPGHPADPESLEVLSVTPGPPSLHDEAQEWLDSDGRANAIEAVSSDLSILEDAP